MSTTDYLLKKHLSYAPDIQRDTRGVRAARFTA